MIDLNMKILVVDDFSTMRRITKKLLREIGFHAIDEADDGMSAVPMLREQDYDLVITDWNMPGLSGLELLKTIRSDSKMDNETPVLMITAESKRHLIIEAAQAGVDGYVIKPFTDTTLREKVYDIFMRIAKNKLRNI